MNSGKVPAGVPAGLPLAELLGRRFRHRRVHLGLSLTSVAEAVGLGVSSLSNIETGQRNASLPVVLRLCRALYLRVEEVLDTKPQTLGWQGPGLRGMEGEVKELSLQLLTDPEEYRVAMISATLPFGHQCSLNGAPAGVLTVVQKSGCSIIRSEKDEEVLRPGDALTFRRRSPAIWLSVDKGHSTALWVIAPGGDWRHTFGAVRNGKGALRS